jgi:hypothetical protein
MKDERHESGTGCDNVQAELAGEVVAETGGAHFGDGDSAGGDDEGGRAIFGGVSAHGERGVAPDFADFGINYDFYIGVPAFRFEHADDLSGGIVAEELAESFLMIRNAVLFDEGDEIGRGVTREGGLGEMRICGEEVFRLGVEIREVAAAAAGDEDFFADFIGAFEKDYATAALSGFDGAHQAGGTGAQNDYIEVVQSGSPRSLLAGRNNFLEHPGPCMYTGCRNTLLQGACEERRKDRTMFIARMVAVL